MKKLCTIALAVILILSLGACGRRNDKTPGTTTVPTTAPTTIPPTTDSILPDMDPTSATNIPDPEVDTSMPDIMDDTTTPTNATADANSIAGK